MGCALALGTAQFGSDYGVKGDGQPTPDEIARILTLTKRAGIEVIDTAPAYGCACGFEGFKVVQKTPYTGEAYALLQHDPDGDLGPVLEARESGRVQKAGISIYTPAQLERALKWPIDIVQIPLNIVDGRFLPWLPVLRQRGIEIHARSVFLQGALLMDDPPVPVPKLDVATCLGYVLAQDVGAVVVGVNSEVQLRELLAVMPQDAQNYGITAESIVDPRKWRRRTG